MKPKLYDLERSVTEIYQDIAYTFDCLAGGATA
jgi:hypothetical protein